MTQHTPGPWYVSGNAVHASYRWICTIRASQGDQTRLTDYANARLIAAAPEMLGWLSELATALHAHAQDDDARDLAKRARALLARIEGK